MKLLTIAVLAILTCGPALANPDCPNRRRSSSTRTRTVYVERESSAPQGGWTYQGYNEYLGY